MKDITVVITGATSGLGGATTLQPAQKEAFIVILLAVTPKLHKQEKSPITTICHWL